MLHKWDIIRAIREEQFKQARKKLNKMERSIKWIKLGYTVYILKQIHAKFDAHLTESKLNIKKNETCWQINKVFQRHLRKLYGARE